MINFEITYNRKDCIGCGACASLDEDGKYWVMDAEAGTSKLVDGKETTTGSGVYKREVTAVTEEDLELNKSAHDACPVKVIEVEEC